MILKIRGAVFVFLLCFLMAVYWPIPLLAGFLLSEKTAYYVATLWGRWVLWLLKYVVGITYRVHGAENIPDKPCVILAKHQSALDIFVLLKVFDPQTWVLKKELLNIPCFGWVLWATKPIAIDRKQGRKALGFMIERGIEKLSRGFWVILYPEGTRTLPGEKTTYKSGGVMLAKKANADIVPVALNTGLFWQKGRGAVNNGVVDIVVGPAIKTTDKNIKTLSQETEQWIEKNSLAITLKHPYYHTLKKTKSSTQP